MKSYAELGKLTYTVLLFMVTNYITHKQIREEDESYGYEYSDSNPIAKKLNPLFGGIWASFIDKRKHITMTS